ncbi:hypothetical protein KVR01_011693 [Diaporthe batatas]|uniref:uncharacterized protein n=1 Tax=Diaporthe batatas TaxID=748121 RepID=UPI001D0546E8|nr:uncharacterized protein KVR01_011693 [Diaporthe batatas]KAG8158571.1 hypothetical protein KVR01_011693 [Diaporthe batatas]
MKGSIASCLLVLALRAVSALPSLVSRADMLDTYDYVIVGGGTGGMTLASRLSEDGTNTVLLIEAGSLDKGEREIVVPRFYVGTLSGVPETFQYAWHIKTAPQAELGNRSITIAQGKLIGGGSSINAMVYDRGRAADYDSWADIIGSEGWNAASLLPYFKKAETFTPPPEEQAKEFKITYNPECHGFEGPIQSSYAEWVYPQHNEFMDAMDSLGVRRPLDQSCGDTLGAYFTTHSIHPVNRSRSYPRVAHFDPTVDRANLHVLIEHQATRIVTHKVDGIVKVTGVEFAASRNAAKQIVGVHKEAVLSAGAFHSPQILQLSGIGKAIQLGKLGISSVVDLPGVGQNLQDHCAAPTLMRINPNLDQAADLNNATFDHEQGELYYSERKGRWTTGPLSSVLFLPLLNYTEYGERILDGMAVDISTSYLPDDIDPSVKAGYEAQLERIVKMHKERSTAGQELMYVGGGTGLSSILMHPLSRGWVRLNSTDPFDDPLVDPRYLSHPSDRQLFVEAVRYNRKIIATEALQRTGAAETFPGGNVTSDEAILNSLRNRINTVWHPSGTCAMMPREIGGVVDAELKVYGVDNLRVLDASVMPILPAAHMQGTVYAMAEKAADMMLSVWI